MQEMFVLQLGSTQVRSIHPRNQSKRGTNRESCGYFHDTGKCAFGTRCCKEHDPRLFSDQAQRVLTDADTDLRQQLTLHLASIPEKYEEHNIRHVSPSLLLPPPPKPILYSHALFPLMSPALLNCLLQVYACVSVRPLPFAVRPEGSDEEGMRPMIAET